MQDNSKLFRFAFLDKDIFISDQNVKVKNKGNRNKNCIFSFLGNPKGSVLDYFLFFNFSYELIPISMS